MTRRLRIRKLILDTADDFASAFLWDDRKDDEELDRETLAEAINQGWITPEDVIERFSEHLRAGWQAAADYRSQEQTNG